MQKEFAQAHERYAQLATQYPDTDYLREAQKKFEELRRTFPEYERLAKELQAKLEKDYPKDFVSADQFKALAHAQDEFARIQKQFQDEVKREAKERDSEDIQEKRERAAEDREKAEYEADAKIWNKEHDKLIHKGLDKQIHKEVEAEVRARVKEQADLSRLATVSMDRAIQIANSRQPGKVVSATLGRQKNGQLYYRLIIVTGEDEKSTLTHVWVSATDGSIIKTEHE